MNSSFFLPNERIIIVLHRHWFILFSKLLGIVFLSLVPLGVAVALSIFYPTLITEKIFSTIFWYIASLYWVVMWFAGVLIWLDWYLDSWILTDQRVIDIDLEHLFSRRVTECRLEKIQNVTSQTSGVLATFFDYGDVTVETAAETLFLTFHQVPFPHLVQNTVSEIHHQYLKKDTPRSDV